ncbi:MAG: IS982 family transposase [Ignavibacteria bacterium]|jgi:hypothetical protein
MKDITVIYCEVDDFYKTFKPTLDKKILKENGKKRNKPSKLSPSEIITIMILFHNSNYRTLKNFYLNYVKKFLSSYFPTLLSYNRFVELQKSSLFILFAFLFYRKSGERTGIYFIDSTTIQVCKQQRISSHKVFKSIAGRGKTSMGWFYGFKLHLIVNDMGEIIAFMLTPGNVDDRNENVIDLLTKDLEGKLFGDRGYIKQELFEYLYNRGLKLFTKLRKNMKNKLFSLEDKLILRKRSIIETINDQLKNVCQIEHSRHRSVSNFLVNLISGLVAYAFKERKPRLNIASLDNQLVIL